MFTKQNLQINRGRTTANTQGSQYVTVIHTYKDTTLTAATIKSEFPPYLDQGSNQDMIIVNDHILIKGSDASQLCTITSLDPFTVSADLFGGASGLSVGTPVVPPLNNNALQIVGDVLQAQIADASFNGVVSTTAQTFSGIKTFTTGITVNGTADFGTANVVNFMQGNTQNNIPIGPNAADSISTGTECIGIGHNALTALTTGNHAIAIGHNALAACTTADEAIAIGRDALSSNTVPIDSLAIGTEALKLANSTSNANTAVGQYAMPALTTGQFNTAIGAYCLESITAGSSNVGIGYVALDALTVGLNNTAVGVSCLQDMTSASFNTGVGNGCLAIATGGSNTAVGSRSGNNITTGVNNLFLGESAGTSCTGSDSNNILLKHNGSAGTNDTIRIGTPGTHTKNFQAGVRGVTTANADAIAVLVDSASQLGTVSSLRSMKENINEIDEIKNAEILKQLTPVRFDYIDSKGRSQQFGLIADDVLPIYPDICAFDADGQLQTIFYDRVNIMILKEVQRLQKEVEALKARG